MTTGIWDDIATWIGPTVNEDPGQMSNVVGVVLHIQQGSEAGTEAWERNPKSQVSSHFLADKSGKLWQMVPVTDKAWCEVAGNRHWLSVECEGYTGQSLSLGQLRACAAVLVKAHDVYGVPLQLCDNPGALEAASGGLGWHGMGGAAWGGHFNCPGAPIVAQRSDIIQRAAQLVLPGDNTGGNTMTNPTVEAFVDRTINGVRIGDILGREDGFNKQEVVLINLISATVQHVDQAVAQLLARPVGFTDAQVANLAASIATRLPQTGPEDEATIRAALVDVLHTVTA